MSMTALIALGLAAFLCSLVAGFLLAFAVVVMPGIRNLGDREYLRAFREIDGVIQRGHPLFGLVWLGSMVVLVIGLGLGLGQVVGVAEFLVEYRPHFVELAASRRHLPRARARRSRRLRSGRRPIHRMLPTIHHTAQFRHSSEKSTGARVRIRGRVPGVPGFGAGRREWNVGRFRPVIASEFEYFSNLDVDFMNSCFKK